MQQQLIASYIEGFLQRETMGPESAEELVGNLAQDVRRTAGRSRTDARSHHCSGARRRSARAACYRSRPPVARYAEVLGHELGMSEQELSDLVFAGLVHDVGKLVMPERLLMKQGPLTEDEYYIVKMHSVVSSEIVECVPKSANIAEIVRHHHERYDGSGYPDGLRGEQIPLASRVLAVADAYATMVEERPFASARSIEEAAHEIERGSGTQFDPYPGEIAIALCARRTGSNKFLEKRAVSDQLSVFSHEPGAQRPPLTTEY